MLLASDAQCKATTRLETSSRTFLRGLRTATPASNTAGLTFCSPRFGLTCYSPFSLELFSSSPFSHIGRCSNTKGPDQGGRCRPAAVSPTVSHSPSIRYKKLTGPSSGHCWVQEYAAAVGWDPGLGLAYAVATVGGLGRRTPTHPSSGLGCGLEWSCGSESTCGLRWGAIGPKA